MILITGGAGYIGSHCALALLKQGKNVIIFDNLSTGHIETVESLSKFGNLKFIQGDLLNKDDLESLFKNNKINAVIHFAAFSQVGESVKNPEKYYIYITDPMLATGNSLLEAIKLYASKGIPHSQIRVISIIAAPQGIANIQKHFPDVEIITAALDRTLNEKGYILPGMGDAGDRIFNT